MTYIAFKTQASNPQKPGGMPDAWPWGQIIFQENDTPPDQSGEWVVMTLEAFNGYKAIHRPAFDAYVEAEKQAQEILNDLKQKNKDKVAFCTELLLRFKQKNILENINAQQAIWLHHRIRNLEVNFPGMPATNQDIINIALSGDIEAGLLMLQYCVADDMSESYHWLSQDRVNWLISEIQSFLGA